MRCAPTPLAPSRRVEQGGLGGGQPLHLDTCGFNKPFGKVKKARADKILACLENGEWRSNTRVWLLVVGEVDGCVVLDGLSRDTATASQASDAFPSFRI